MSRYGSRHQSLRRALVPTAAGKPCVRCGESIRPGEPVDLDHADDGSYLGMAHRRCNRADGARRTNRERAMALRAVRGGDGMRRKRKFTVVDCALAVEVSSTREKTAVVSAARVEGDERVVITLLAWLDGADGGVDEVLRLRGELPVRTVVVDGVSPSATLVMPLRDARVDELVEPNGHDVAVAGGWFIDWFKARRLWFPDPHPALTTAMREVDLRSLAGASALDRRNPVVAPAVGAELALWGLLSAPSQEVQLFFG